MDIIIILFLIFSAIPLIYLCQLIVLIFFYKDWNPDPECLKTNVCQETKDFEGTEHEGIDMCEDGCVRGHACIKFKFFK